jgi:hypothetical protein
MVYSYQIQLDTEQNAPAIQAPKVLKAEAQGFPTYKTFPTAGAAVKYLIKKINPDYISFGEFHQEYDMQLTSTSERFAEEIISVLKKNKFHDLVIEFAPDDPRADAELRTYKETGKLSGKHTPILIEWMWLSNDAKGIGKLYEKATEMNLYGSNLSLDEKEDEKKGKISKRNASIKVKTRTQKKVDGLLKKGKKVVSYGGFYHNDIKPDPGEKEISFGPYFKRKCSYLEIDLIVPEIFEAFPKIFKEKRLYRNLVPEKGVLLIQESKREFIMLFPYSVKPKSK